MDIPVRGLCLKEAIDAFVPKVPIVVGLRSGPRKKP